jgi:hypothetical protein
VGMSYVVELVVGDTAVGPAGKTRWPEDGNAQLPAQETGGPVQVVVVPVRYSADGSGRMPATSDTAIANLKAAVMAFYPIDEVNMVVSSTPLDWNSIVQADGIGWEELLNAVTLRRDSDGVGGNIYYMGLFNPKEKYFDFNDSANSYCNMGCVTGLSWQTTRVSDSWSRASLSIGYDDSSTAYTVAHELGHAHGRGHSPSGGADYADPNYPVPNGKLDVMGYSISQNVLISTDEFFDFMGYDYPQWTSAYTYSGLFQKVTSVNQMFGTAGVSALPLPRDASATLWKQILVRSDGTGKWGIEMKMTAPPSGEEMTVYLYDDNGQQVDTTTGYFTPFAGLSGGALWLQTAAGEAVIADVPALDLVVAP